MPARLTITIPDSVMADVELHKPRSLSLAAFCALLIDRGLTSDPTTQTMGEPAARRASSKAVSSSKNSLNKSFSMSLPAELEPERAQVLEFWKIKRGSKGETAWKLLTGELLKIQQKYGDAVLREQLALGINGKWQSITLRNFEQFLPKGNTAAQAVKPRKKTEEEIRAEEEAAHQQRIREMGLI